MTTIKETATALGEKVSGAKDAVLDARRSASNLMDQARTDTAGALHSAAAAVRAAGSHSAAAVEDATESAGQKLDSTSSYIRKNDAGDMLHDLRRVVRKHPGAFLILTAAVAALAGYLAATNNNRSRS